MSNLFQYAIAGIITLTYIYLVVVKIASPEGFIVLAGYVIKKVLDIAEDNQPTQGGQK